MKIGVLMKQVPARDSELVIDSDESWIDESDVTFETCETDDFALEAALQLKESEGGEVVVLSLGPDRAQEMLRATLAKGADRAIHIVDEHGHGLDPLQVAGALAAAAIEENFDLILAGIQSDDCGYGQTGVMLAELLGLPHATVVMEMRKTDGVLRLKRELEAGWYQIVELPLPAIVTIQSGINKPRYTPVKGILAARRKEIRRMNKEEVLPSGLSPGIDVRRIYVAEETKDTELLEGSPERQAAALVEKLKYSARVL